MIYLELFWSFFQIGLFSVGGGYGAMPLIQHQVVEVHPWLTMSQFADIMAIAEMTPGPIAINAATFSGIQAAGFLGGVAATIGCVFPSWVIVMALGYIYHRYQRLHVVQGILGGLRPAAIAMVASAGVTLWTMALYGQQTLPVESLMPRPGSMVIFLMAFFLLRRFRPHPLVVMGLCGLCGLALFSLAG